MLHQTLTAVPGALASLGVIIGMGLIGHLVSRSKSFQAADVLYGWAVAAIAMTLAGVLFNAPLIVMAVVLLALEHGRNAARAESGFFTSPFWMVAIFRGLVVC